MMRRLVTLCILLLAGCDYPPDEATNIQERLQAQISKGQVYVLHSTEELSYVIKNSEFNTSSEADQNKLIRSVEDLALEILSKYREFKQIKIYFVGSGSAGIKSPYICQSAANACLKTIKKG